jgi:Tfp pilus assembly protein FimT
MITSLLLRKRIPFRGGRCQGATLVELLTLVVLLLLLAAFAIPSFSPIVLRYRIRGAAWQVAGDLRLARQRAVTMKKPFRFCVTGCIISVPPGGYSVERDDGPPGGPRAWVNESGVATRLPPDVAIAANANPTFTIIGSVAPSETGTVTLSNLLGAYNVVVAQSGRVRVCEGACP